MANKTIRQWSRNGKDDVDVLYIGNSDGPDGTDLTYSQSVIDGSSDTATGLTDTQLRLTPLPVSGPLTDTQIRLTPLPVSGPLTDTQLRLTALPVSVPASELHIGKISGQGDSIHCEFARPSDTTAYSINDVVGPAVTGLLSFTNISRVVGGSLYIVKARLMTNQSTNTATYRLHLYQTTSPAAIADNAQFAILWANRAVRMGYIDFDPVTTEGTGSDCVISLNKDIRLHVKCDASIRTIYGVLETKSVFTPTSAQVFFIDLNVEQD